MRTEFYNVEQTGDNPWKGWLDRVEKGAKAIYLTKYKKWDGGNLLKAKLVSLIMITVLFLAACSGGTASEEKVTASSSGEPQILRVSIGVNDQHPEYEGIKKFKELVESKTEDFEIELYHSGQIADDRSAIEMLQLGSLDFTFF